MTINNRDNPGLRVMTTKDVQLIIDKTERTARRLMRAIRKKYKKERHHMITVREFCKYTGFPEEDVLRKLDHPTQ